MTFVEGNVQPQSCPKFLLDTDWVERRVTTTYLFSNLMGERLSTALPAFRLLIAIFEDE